jgi:hypothetical protein
VIVNTIDDKLESVSTYVGVNIELAPSFIVSSVPDEVGLSFTLVCVKTTKEVLLISPFALVTL